MSWKGYEFECLDCGRSYLRGSTFLTRCPNQSCKGRPMQLYAVVETMEEHPFGMLAYFLSRRIIDKPKGKWYNTNDGGSSR